MTDLSAPGGLLRYRRSGARIVLLSTVTVGLVALVLIFTGRSGGFRTQLPTGGGSGEVTVEEIASPLVINQAPVLAKLYPGGPAQTLGGAFTNSGTAPVTISSVTAILGEITGGNASCSLDSFELAGAVMTVGRQIPVGAQVGSWGGATIQMLDTPRNQDGCRAADVQISYTAR